MLEVGWQKSIREKNGSGDTKGANKDLRMIRMSSFFEDLNITDKLTVIYGLSYHMYKDDKNFEFANKYLEEMKEIFEDVDIMDYQVDYHKYLWLNVNVNHEKMETIQILKDMSKVYQFYKENANIEATMSALSSLSMFKRDEETILFALETLLQSEITDYNFINSVLKDCAKINHNLYIKGRNLIDKYTEIGQAN